MKPKPYTFTYMPKPPYWFTGHLERFSLPNRPLPWIYDWGEKSCRRLIGYREALVPVKVYFRGEPWMPSVKTVIWSRSAEQARGLNEALLECIRARFDYREFLAVLDGWPRLRVLAEKYPGLRPGRTMSLYEALVDSVVKQRIALRMALRVQSRLVSRYGAKLVMKDEVFYSFPLPEALASSKVEDLYGLGLTRMKARALREIALAEVEGRLPSVGEVVRDPQGNIEELTGLYGVGRWTAELSIAMVHPRFPVGPASDLAVSRGLERLLGLKLSEARLRELLEDLGDYLGLIMYLAAYDYESAKKRGRQG
ncbi:MAG: hypothetical protein F7C38_05455 [Desulfurococcales archaeon]|nr:hypothetical protein [Desulfurococcales archaeon]